MSSPVHDDQDKRAMYAPPWARETERDDDDNRRIQAEIAAAAERLKPRAQASQSEPQQKYAPRRNGDDAEARASLDRPFELEDAIRDAWIASRLEPVRMPPPPEVSGPPWAMLSRLTGAAGFAAVVALFVTGVIPLPSINISITRDDIAATAAPPAPKAAATRGEPTRPAAALPASAPPQPPAARPAPPPPPTTVAVANAQSFASSYAALRPEAPRPPQPSVPQPRVLDFMNREEIEQLLKRGHEQLANGDISGGRLLLMRAAEAGEARASFALGSSYDAAVMAYLGVVGVPPDAAKARAWYMKAAEQGSQEATRRLERLATR